MGIQDFSKKWVLITGGASGIGAACVARFVEGGASVICIDKNIEQLNTLPLKEESKTYLIRMDLSDAKAIQDRLPNQVRSLTDKLDILVNCAGIQIGGMLEDVTVEDWDLVMNINTRAIFLVCKSLLHFLKKADNAAIVNVASGSSFMPQIRLGAYSPSKAATMMLSQLMAVEWAKYGIRVNSVCPGPIATPLTDAIYADPELRKARTRAIPLGRFGEAHEVASLVTFLAGEDASYITGGAYPVDGGSLVSVFHLTAELMELSKQQKNE
ncbi:putative Bacilysin biosynthesis oxidoreductase BacC [Syntrophobacter sp. SbD1]|nr:putative Bacilysin biosynthesis oxidoreductase BacC [Syntrophobacter sp. SbD1]